MILLEIYSLMPIVLFIVPHVISEYRQKLPCKFTDSINITEGIHNETDGSILHNGLLYGSKNYALIDYTEVSSNYEIERSIVENPYFRGCICQVTNCVWLCCYEFEDIKGIPTCLDSNITELLVDVDDGPGVSSYELDLIKNGSLHLAPRLIDSHTKLYEKDEWSMNSTGYIQSENKDILQESYCLYESFSILNPVFWIFEDKYSEISFMISLPFMLVTLLIYLCIPELRNTHGKCLICYVFSMTCSFTIMLYKVPMAYGVLAHWSSCYHFLYFWYMAGIFWLNVICFDIFWTFSSGTVMRNERKKFLYYSLYAWGIPLVLVGLLTAIDRTSFVPEEFRPNITSDCRLGGDKFITFIYMYSVMLVLVLVNIFFFILTVTRIIGVQRATDAVLHQGSKRHSSVENRYRIHLFLRLFVVMGISWSFVVLNHFICPMISCEYPTDLLNDLIGVFIFLLFVCKTNVKDLILKRIRKGSKSIRTTSTSLNNSNEVTVPLRQLSRMELCPEISFDDNC